MHRRINFFRRLQHPLFKKTNASLLFSPFQQLLETKRNHSTTNNNKLLELRDCNNHDDLFNFFSNFYWNKEYFTEEFLLTLSSKADFVESDIVAAKVGIYISQLYENNNKYVKLNNKEIYNLLINHAFKHATGNDSVRMLAEAVALLTMRDPENQLLFSTPEATIVLTKALKEYAKSDECVGNLGAALGFIAETDEGQLLLSTEETASALLIALQNYATSPESVQYLCGAIVSITSGNSKGKELFLNFNKNPQGNETVQVIIRHALENFGTTPTCLENIVHMIGNLSSTEEGRKMFSTKEFCRPMILALSEKYATTTSASVETICTAIGNIAFENSEGKSLFSDSESVSALIGSLKKYSVSYGESPDCVFRIALAIENIISGNNIEGQRMFSAHTETISVLEKALEECVSTKRDEPIDSRGVCIEILCNCIEILKEQQNQN